MDFKERSYVALDAGNVYKALDWAKDVSGIFGYYKAGPVLISQALKTGVPVMGMLHHLNPIDNGNVFVDVKLHDTPSTVYRAVKEFCSMTEVSMLTIYIDEEEMCREAMRGAIEAREGYKRVGENGIYAARRPKIMGITELSSSGSFDINKVMRKAELAIKYGLDGVVSHAAFTPKLEKVFGQDLAYVATGLEFKGTSGKGQQNPYPLERAIMDSENSFLVIGSALTGSGDIKKTAYEMAMVAAEL